METAASRFNGKLTKWNAERGFGFLVAEHGEQELFLHVSAFPRDGRPPAIGEPLSFEMELDKEGRKRAVRVRRVGIPRRSSSRIRWAGVLDRHLNAQGQVPWLQQLSCSF